MMKKTPYKHITLTGAILGVTGDPIAGTLKGDRYYPVAFFSVVYKIYVSESHPFKAKNEKCPAGQVSSSPSLSMTI